MTEETPFNLAAIEMLRRLGSGDFLVRMIDLFFQHTPEKLEALRTGLATGDAHAVEQAAHAMKSSAGQLGGAALQHAAQSIEDRAKAIAATHGDVTVLGPSIEQLHGEYDTLHRWLEGIRTETLASKEAEAS